MNRGKLVWDRFPRHPLAWRGDMISRAGRAAEPLRCL